MKFLLRSLLFLCLPVAEIGAFLPSHHTAQANALTAQADNHHEAVTLLITLENNSSRLLTIEDKKAFKSDNPGIGYRLLKTRIPSRDKADIAALTWPVDGISNFYYALGLKSDNHRYDCTLSIKALYYDNEVNGVWVIRPKILTQHVIDDAHPACEAYKFSTSFKQHDRYSGILLLRAENF